MNKIAVVYAAVSVMEIAKHIRKKFNADIAIHFTNDDDRYDLNVLNIGHNSSFRVAENQSRKSEYYRIVDDEHAVIEIKENDRPFVEAVLSKWGGCFIKCVNSFEYEEYFG